MNKEQWLDQAKRDEEKLAVLVRSFHPMSGQFQRNALRVTAPNVEMARRTIVGKIRREAHESGNSADPVDQLRKAINERNLDKVNALLNSAWFGVPESTDCWGLEGFREAVDLMEDLPNDEDEN